MQILNLKNLLRKCPMLTITLAFLSILAVGGVLETGFAIFAILAIIGGYALPIIYGVRLGLAPHEAVALCLGIFMYLSYSLLCILRELEDHVRAKAYIKSLKKHFKPAYKFFTVHAGKFGTFGILVTATFVAGWWLAVILAFIAELEMSYTMGGIFVGLVCGGLLALGLYFGAESIIDNPLALAAIFTGIGLAMGTIIHILTSRMRKRRKTRVLHARNAR